MDTGGARPLNHSSPSRVTGPTQRTDFFHGLLALARIMREGAVEGETQEPPCGTNVVLTTF